ncbi:MAG: ATP-binding protein [Anaerolineae bacterium]|nr:ATP-binding protein [Anaerolineae bacterium]
MANSDHFPAHLLSQSPAERLAYFTQKLVAHPRLTQAYEELWHAIGHANTTSLVFVFGPTGVGKTTLRRRIEQRLTEDALPTLADDPARLPVIALEALAPETGNFSWKDFYTRALLTCDEPLVERKIDYGVRGLHRDQTGQLFIRRDASTAGLRQAWEQCLRYRQPAAVLIDEAQHLQKVSNGRRLLDQMDVLKSLASLTQTVHVLIGTYELLNLLRLSAQLSRRSIEIHFPRYQPGTVQDIKAFTNILWTFQQHLPLAEVPDLVGRYDYFYERSAGCVGLLKDWLNRALAAALNDGQQTLTHAYLERQVLPFPQLKRIASEIKMGEETMVETPHQQAELRALLGMTPGPQPSQTEPPPARSQHPPFQRKPVRDPIGVDTHG